MVTRYLVTAAATGAPPSKGFLTCLDAYAKRISAEIIICPIPGARRDERIARSLQRKYTVAATDRPLCETLDLRVFRLRASQIDPLTGLSRFIQFGRSAVIPSPKQFFRGAACIVGLPKVLYTTGACTEPDYSDTRVGDIGTEDHVIGAVVVETDGHLFHARHIRYKKTTRGFTDLGTMVTLQKGKAVFEKVRAEAIIPGDWHAGDTDPVARASVLAMMREYRPKKLVLHDIFNGHSISHHEAGKGVSRAIAADKGRLGLEKELEACADEVAELCRSMPADGKVFVAKSNHDEWLARYLESARFVDDAENYRIALDLAAAAVDGKDPLAVGLRRNHAKLEAVQFLARDESLRVGGWELGQHGDLGINGGGAGIRSIEAAAGHAVVGHTHSPQVFRGLIVVGTTTKLRLPYNRGPSTWLPASALIWPDGSGQLVVQLADRGGDWTFAPKTPAA